MIINSKSKNKKLLAREPKVSHVCGITQLVNKEQKR
jgi:hypothetical protein